MSTIGLNTIKDKVRQILVEANTGSSANQDLSENMRERVKKVLTLNVERLPIQPSFFPCITMFYDSKRITLQDISRTQKQGKRRAEIDLKIVGIVYHTDLENIGDEYTDQADNECENLMENIEQVLRENPDLKNTALYSNITDTTYHNYPVSEGAYMRAGISNLRIVIFY